MKNGIQKNYLIALAVVIGVIVVGFASSYAYFAITMTSAQDGGPDFVASVDASSESVTVTQLHGINNPDKRPGYKDYLSFSVTSTSSVNYDVTMNAVSTLVTGVNYKVYKSTSSLTVASTCSDSDDAVNSQYSSTCTVTGLDLLTPEATGQISSATTAYTLLEGETLNGTVYYYIVLEYPNEDFSQDDDFFKTLTATVTINTGNATIDTTQPRLATTAVLQDNGIEDINDVPERTNNGGIQYLASSKYYNTSKLNIPDVGFNTTKLANGASGAFSEIYVGEDINIFRTNSAESGETVLYYSGANGYVKDYTYKGNSIYNIDDTLATLDGSPVDLIKVGGRYYLNENNNVTTITPEWVEAKGTCKYENTIIYNEDSSSIAKKSDCIKTVNILDNKIYTGEFIQATPTWEYPSNSFYAYPTWEVDVINATPSWTSECTSWGDGSETCESYSYTCEYNGSEVYDQNGNTIISSSNCQKNSSLVEFSGGYRMTIVATPTWEEYNCSNSDGSTSCDYRCVYNGKNVYNKSGSTINYESDCEKSTPLETYNNGYKMLDATGVCKYNNKKVYYIDDKNSCESGKRLVSYSDGYQVASGTCKYNNKVVKTSNGGTISSSSSCTSNSTLVESGSYYSKKNIITNVTLTWVTNSGETDGCLYNSKTVYKENKRIITSQVDCTPGEYYVNDNNYIKIISEDYITNAKLTANYVGVNNWVIFGQYTKNGPVIGFNEHGLAQNFSSISECQSDSYYNHNCDYIYHAGDDIYWRIIRTNEESTGGGIRLLYSGSGLTMNDNKHIIKSSVNNALIINSEFNTQNDYRSVGYTYGNGNGLSGIRGNNNDSIAKTNIDNWYKATLLNTNYEKEVNQNSVYCNDRSYTSDSSWYDFVYFAARERSFYSPTYACGGKSFGGYYSGGNSNFDRYTSNSNGFGNGWLDYPVALMTADEVSFAGGLSENNNPNAWYSANPAGQSILNNDGWWLMTPFWSDDAHPFVYSVLEYLDYKGYLSSSTVNMVEFALRPVLSLKSDTMITGSGTPTDPYIVQVREN